LTGTKLSTKRRKTNLPVEQYIVSYALEIINRYKDSLDAGINGTIFPPRSLTHLNINIKLLAAICGITKKLSSHIARHTCSGLMDQAGIPDDIVASKMMGWTTGKKTSWIYKSVNDSDLEDRKNKLQLYLDKYLKSETIK
jgi:integrase